MKNKISYSPVGSIVYFSAYPDSSNLELQFFCKGYVIRQPKKDSPVYKVIPFQVLLQSKPGEEENKLSRRLLGKKIPKNPSGVTDTPASWYLKAHKHSIDLTVEEIAEIERQISKNQG